jgi:hypothetical protein
MVKTWNNVDGRNTGPRGRVCAAIFEHSDMKGTLHIGPLLDFPPPREAL